MNLENSLKISLLNEFYGKLLTDKQKKVLTYYYDDNLSLSEIAEKFNISRQAVRDSLVKSEKLLLGYEQKLGLMERYNCLKAEIEGIINDVNSDKLTKDEWQGKLSALLNFWEGQ